MSTGQANVPRHGVLVDVEQTAGGSSSASLADVIEDRDNLVGWKSRVLKRCALAFGEGFLTRSAINHADTLATPRPTAEIKIIAGAFSVLSSGHRLF